MSLVWPNCWKWGLLKMLIKLHSRKQHMYLLLRRNYWSWRPWIRHLNTWKSTKRPSYIWYINSCFDNSFINFFPGARVLHFAALDGNFKKYCFDWRWNKSVCWLNAYHKLWHCRSTLISHSKKVHSFYEIQLRIHWALICKWKVRKQWLFYLYHNILVRNSYFRSD